LVKLRDFSSEFLLSFKICDLGQCSTSRTSFSFEKYFELSEIDYIAVCVNVALVSIRYSFFPTDILNLVGVVAE